MSSEPWSWWPVARWCWGRTGSAPGFNKLLVSVGPAWMSPAGILKCNGVCFPICPHIPNSTLWGRNIMESRIGDQYEMIDRHCCGMPLSVFNYIPIISCLGKETFMKNRVVLQKIVSMHKKRFSNCLAERTEIKTSVGSCSR